MHAELLKIIEGTLEFRYECGDVTEMIAPHTTGWRTLPYLMTASADSRGMVEVAGRGKILGKRNDAICIPPGIHHNCTLLEKRGVSRWSCTTFTVFGGIDLFSLLETQLTLQGAAAVRIAEINTELAQLSRENSQTLQPLARRKTLGFSMLEIIAAQSKWREQNPLVRDTQRLLPVLAFIHQNAGKRIRVEDLARRAHLSVARFHAVFREGTGVAPQQYMLRMRIRKHRNC